MSIERDVLVPDDYIVRWDAYGFVDWGQVFTAPTVNKLTYVSRIDNRTYTVELNFIDYAGFVSERSAQTYYDKVKRERSASLCSVLG